VPDLGVRSAGTAPPVLIPASDAVFEVRLIGGSGTLGEYHSPCAVLPTSEQQACLAACNGTGCSYAVAAPGAQALPFELRVRAVLFNTSGADTSVSWVFKRCSPTEFARLDEHSVIECEPCPPGGDCSPPSPLSQAQLNADADLVQSVNVVSKPGSVWCTMGCTVGLRHDCCVTCWRGGWVVWNRGFGCMMGRALGCSRVCCVLLLVCAVVSGFGPRLYSPLTTYPPFTAAPWQSPACRLARTARR
jgi:hypothetical protein